MVALEFMDSVRHHGRQTSCHRPGNEHHYRGAVWDLFAHRSVGQHGSPTLDPTAGQREVDDVHGSVGEPVDELHQVILPRILFITFAWQRAAGTEVR